MDHSSPPSRWLDDLRQDLLYAVRGLTARKALAATAIVTLALGIGANTALFTVVHGVILRPLPFHDPDRLVQLYGRSPLVPERDAVPDLDAYRRQATSFETIVGYDVSARYLRDGAGSERVMAVRAERDFFTMLGVSAVQGRRFESADPLNVVVIGEAFWRRRFGADPSAIGRAMTLDNESFTIIGVMPEWFQFPYGAASLLPGVASEAQTDVWLPLQLPAERRVRLRHVTGRLKPHVRIEEAGNELAVISSRLQIASPDLHKDRSVYLTPLADSIVSASVRRPLFLLLGAVAMLLALACANVTNLSLVQMTLRSREVAVRAALGARPGRLARQFLTESLLLAFTGGAIGLALAIWATGRLMQLARVHVPRAPQVAFDWPVFLFLLGVCVVTAAAFGLAPALIAWRINPQPVLQASGGHGAMGAGFRRLRDSLVTAEIALAFLLAVGATLAIRELARLHRTDTGMAARHALTLHVGHRMTPQTDVRQFYAIADRVAQLPGVVAAGFTQILPLQNWGWSSNSSDFRVRGRAAADGPTFPIELRYVTPGYFAALGVPLRAGRMFTDRDTREAPRVIVINETLARQTFGPDDPVGRETTRGTIVGVVGDVRQVNIDRPAAPEIYFPVAQNWSQLSELGMTLVVGTREEADRSIDPVRTAIRDVNPDLAVFEIKTLDRVIGDSLSSFTLFLWLMGAFAAVALALAITGTYGVISYVATSRAGEFAVRTALGADRARLTRLVFAQGARLTAIGLALGITAALTAAPLLEGLPVTVRPPDVATVGPIALLVALAALAACVIPARRAASVDPMQVLRSE